MTAGGRLATITYPVIGYDAQNQLGVGTTTFVDMFSYETYGAIKGKRLRVIKTNPFFQSGQYKTQTATGDLNMSYAHDLEGKVTAVTYPTDANAGVTPQYNYQYDAMSRPSGMSDQNAATVVSGVLYGAANELLSMNYDGETETRSYNAMFQLTGISGLGQNITYNFPAGSNNGKIASQYDAVSGETVSYQYDSLNRLISASAAGWSQSYSYDGFGNLTNRVGTGAAVGNNPTAADPVTNRLVNAAYDANGNMLSTGNVYDVENRLMQAAMAGGTIQYAYDGQNKRIWQGSFTNSGDPQMLMLETVSMFGADGQLAATYTPGAAFNNTTNPVGITFALVVQRVYFGKKLIKWLDAACAAHNAVQDRLGSVGKYYPYGEERNSPPMAGDQVKFATYTRDSATGLDYADQRHYGSAFGRFITPDPYRATATSPSRPSDPLSWNRYAYVKGDPINLYDPIGLDSETPGKTDRSYCDDHPFEWPCQGDYPGEGGGGGQSGGGSSPWDLTHSSLVAAAAFISVDEDLWNIEPCANDLNSLANRDILGAPIPGGKGAPGPADIIRAASNVQFYDATTTPLPTPPGFVGPVPLVSSVFQPNQIAAAWLNTNQQYWMPGVEASDAGHGGIPMTVGRIDGIVLHELLHNLGYSDTDIQLSVFGPGGVSRVTDNISDRLTQDCFPALK